MLLAILFILIGVFTRLSGHLPNFSPMAAVALFSGVYLNKKHGYLIPLSIYIISDIFLGLHNTVIFTWGTIVLIYFLGTYLKKNKSITTTITCTLAGSIGFFLITNFGVWIMGWYPRTIVGLGQCFVAAIPFFRTSLLSNFAYVAVFFSAYEYFLAKTKVLKQAV